MRILPQETLVLGIDYQERLIPAIHDGATIIRNSVILFEGLKLLDIPMLISRQYPKGLGDSVQEIREAADVAQVLDKTTFSCYQDQGIKSAVDGAKRKNVIICGTEAHVCALQTTIDLQAAGYQVVYVVDCVGSRKELDKKYGIKRAQQEGAILATYESLLFELTAGAGSPAFKGVSQLVK